jgi:hypothetical protein
MAASNAEPGFLEFAWVWNRRLRLDTPAVHRRIARWLEAREKAGETRLLLMAFRGCGKSTLVGLWCAWLLARRPPTRILVLAADAALAVKMVASVRRIVERHPLCRHLLPDTAEAWASDRFTVAREGALRDPSMLAQGIGGNVTGSRAEVIICDDVEVAGNCDTPGKRAELRERLAEAEFILTPGGTILFVGTPHTEDSLYRHPKEDGAFLRGYRRLAVPAMNAAGAAAWPERFPREALAALRDRVGPLQFQRQMLLQPVAASAVRLDPAAIIRYADEPDYREAHGRGVLTLLGHRLASGGAFWDPAYGRPGTGDASVLACVFSDGDGRHFLHRLAYLTHDPADPLDPATQQCRAVARILGELLLPAVRVETNGLGRFLPALLRRELARAGVACQVIDHASTRAKEDRILAALEPALAARRLHAHESVFRTPFAGEMAEWRPGAAGARDDALDAVSGCLLAEPVRLVRGAPPSRRPSWRGG